MAVSGGATDVHETMPATPHKESPPLPSHGPSNALTAHPVRETVMAEQVSGHVVDHSESAGGPPLADLTAHTTTATFAEGGDHEHLTTEKPTTTDSLLPDTDTTLQTAADPSAEPSAGDAVGESADLIDILDKSVASDSQLENGVHDAALSADDASVDLGLNSDTEGSRGDASELKNDEKHHARSNSVKKPLTFSRVSVAKQFLAKSASTTPPIPKAGEKPSPVGTPQQPSALKPRLIAKTGPSLANMQKARAGTEVLNGPDASKVWNKNRPVPLPPPKQFTDEELKQQYGIHLATRLQTDENGKDSKWADIDDEDDWAPEAVVWMDGTKSSLAAHEAPPPEKEEKPASPQPTKPAEATRPVLALKRDLGPAKTILKPGASTAAAQAKMNAAGTTSDNQVLSSTSPAPAPSKSPWAALPPIEKVSPVNPPVQQSLPRTFATQDARAYEPPSHPSQPAREIAADTFDRSWREGEGGARELFNSANGRYEPVQEGRRGSIKAESSYRKPAVLQRPSQGSAQPAEPSAAFQSRTTTQMDGPWARRRGSSVSQASMPQDRRASFSKGSDISPVPERRTSTVIGHDLRSASSGSKGDAAKPVFAQQSAWQQQMPPQPETAIVEEEDLVKVQEKVMRETRELAKKRREEEEARLEAEKQERLKAKLAGLGSAGKSRKEREAEAAAAATTAQPSTVETPGEKSVPIPADGAQAQPGNAAEMAAAVAPALESQSMPPPPEAPSARQTSPQEVLPAPLPPKPQATTFPERPTGEPNQREQAPAPMSPKSAARTPFQQQQAAYRPPASSYSSPGDRKQQPFGRSPLPNSDAHSLWPSRAPNPNVWGTAGIGNGTFDNANGLFAPMALTQQNSALPPPPGMTRISPQSRTTDSRSPSMQQQPVVDAPRGFAPPGLEPHPDPFASQGRASGASPAPGIGRQTTLPPPIAPPSRAQQQQPMQAQDKMSAWNNAARNLPYQYQAAANAAETNQKEAIPTAPREDRLRETFKQTSAQQGKLGGPRRYDKTEYTIHDAHGSRSVETLSPAPPSAQTQTPGPFSATSPVPVDSLNLPGENTVRLPDNSQRPTQVLPQPPIGPPHAQQPGVSSNPGIASFSPPPTTVSDAEAPPPPETSEHPAHSGDVNHPLIKLPPEIVIPKVKLPPAPVPAQSLQQQQQNQHQQNQYQQHQHSMLPPRPISNVGGPGSKPIVLQEAWQKRFNGLFNRTPIQTETPPSPPKTPPKMQGPALAVKSSSRDVMDDGPAATGATVHLPLSPKTTSLEGFTVDDSDEIVSKPAIEQMFVEELSFGSSPKVTVPRNPFYPTAVHTPTEDRNLWSSQHAPALLVAHSHPPFDPLEVHHKRREGYFVNIPQLRLINRLVRSKPQDDNRQYDNRKPSAHHHQNQDRKFSGKFGPNNKGKGRDSGPSSTGTGTPSNDSRKPSFQKGASPAPPTPAANSTGAVDKGKQPNWTQPPPKGRGKGPATAVAPTGPAAK